MNLSKFNLSIVIPTYKEKKNFLHLINNLHSNIKISKKNYQIIFVDDNSKDGIEDVFKKIKYKFKNINLIVRRHKPRDLSKSCIYGFERSLFENILVMDADMQHNPKYINKMIKNFIDSECDILVGVRDFDNKKMINLNIFRFIASKFIIAIIHFFLGKITSDPMSGFFLFKKFFYKRVKNKLDARGYKILFDILYSQTEEIKLQEYKIKFDKRRDNKSKMSYKILVILLKQILFKFLAKNFFYSK